MKWFIGFKEFIKWRILAPFRINHFPSSYSSHSELGEDMMIRGVLHHMGMHWEQKGFFIDIGAHHPVSTSNTWHFYRKGWHGINVDATPGSMEAFGSLRPRDINLELCITPNHLGNVPFFCFDNPLLNTFDKHQAETYVDSGVARLIETHQVPSITLTELCHKYVPANTRIDFLSIDIEGLDDVVLSSHDWEKWRPCLVVFEKHGGDIGHLEDDPLVAFLVSHGYTLAGACRYSLIMADSREWGPHHLEST
jgi:FkbM family methyltransferase